MTKLLLTIFTLALAFAASAEQQKSQKKAYERPYGLAGCGLGSMALGKHDGQIFASTTNDSTYTQMFGITSGTSNCIDTPTAEVASKMDHFILVNRAQVQGDVAKGNGESIIALATFMGCSENSAELGHSLKDNYRAIFADKPMANEITDGIISVIKTSPRLSAQCKQLG